MPFSASVLESRFSRKLAMLYHVYRQKKRATRGYRVARNAVLKLSGGCRCRCFRINSSHRLFKFCLLMPLFFLQPIRESKTLWRFIKSKAVFFFKKRNDESCLI